MFDDLLKPKVEWYECYCSYCYTPRYFVTSRNVKEVLEKIEKHIYETHYSEFMCGEEVDDPDIKVVWR